MADTDKYASLLRYGVNYSLKSVMIQTSWLLVSSMLQLFLLTYKIGLKQWVKPGKTKGGSITVPLTSCMTGLESAV